MRDINALRAEVEELRSEIVALSEVSELDETQDARWNEANALFDERKAELDAAEARAARVAELRETVINKPESVRTEQSAPEVIVKRDAFEVLETRGAGMSRAEYRQALVDGNLRALEGKLESNEAEVQVEKVLKRHAGDLRWASEMLERSRPAYERGFFKALAGREYSMSEEERTALSTLTNANGKFALPTHLDPTLIITNTGTSNAVRGIAKVVTLTEGKTWNGLSSAGVTASFDTELSEVSDDSPTFSQPTIDVHQARAFVQYSIQAEQDIDSLGAMLMELLADAKDRLEGAKHCSGSGSGEPFGIFTAIDATAGSEVTSGTAAAIALADLNSVYTGLPVRYRGRSSWLYNPQVGAAIKALGTAVSASFSGDLRDPYAGRINGRPVVESDDAPYVTTTTALDQRLILGDFSNYVIVDKPGSMTVESVPHLFHTSNNLPMGARGVFAHWRTGADSVNDDAFRLLLDKTSA